MPNHNTIPTITNSEVPDPFAQLENDSSFVDAYNNFNQEAGKLDDQNRLEQETIPASSHAEIVATAIGRFDAAIANIESQRETITPAQEIASPRFASSAEVAPTESSEAEPGEDSNSDDEEEYKTKGARRLKSLTNRGDGLLNKIDGVAQRFENGETMRSMAKGLLRRAGRAAFKAVGGEALASTVSNSVANHQAKREAKAAQRAEDARIEAAAFARSEQIKSNLERIRANEKAHAESVYDEAHQMDRNFNQAQADAVYDEAKSANERYDAETEAEEMNERYDLQAEAEEMNDQFDLAAKARQDAVNKARAKRLAKERRKLERINSREARRKNSVIRRTGRVALAYARGMHEAGMASVRAAEAARANEAPADSFEKPTEMPISREQFYAENAE
jgi:hypothetical protein